MRDSAREICLLINEAHQRKVFEPIYKKYSTIKYMRVAQIPIRIRRDAQKRSQASIAQ